MTTLLRLLERHVAERADGIAVVDPAGTNLSFRDLHERVGYFAGVLGRRGLRPSSRVAIVLPASCDALVAITATTCFCACAPLNPALSEREFEFELQDLAIDAVIVEAGSRTAAIAVAERMQIPVLILDHDPRRAGSISLAGDFGEGEPTASSDDQVAFLLHTSGTTAKPKTVPLTQSMLVQSSESVVDALALTPADRYLSVMPLYHIHGLATFLGAFAAGCAIVVPRDFDPVRFWEIVATCTPTWYSSAPTIHQGILRATAALEKVPPCTLRFVRSASAALPVQTIAELERIFGVPVVEFFGMTEATDMICTNPLPPGTRKPGSVGRPVKGVELDIRGPSGESLGEGASGEIVIRGPTIIRAYEHNPEANARSFQDDWFFTGDLGYRDADGYVFLTGRSKEIINRGGEKISPRELDELLMQHPAVHQAVAFAVPHATLGEDVAAAVVLREGARATDEELRDHLRPRVAAFKLPQQIVFLDAIPKGPTGKLQRIGLASKLEAHLRAADVAPEDELEERIARIWAKILRLEKVGVTDSFFALGGDSLTAAQVISEVAPLGIRADTVLRYPSVREIVAAHRRQLAGELPKPEGADVPDARDDARIPLGWAIAVAIASFVAWLALR